VEFEFDFVPMGTVATPETGRVYVDVGNAFCPGVLDHHHPDAPDACTAMLVFNHPEYVLSQVDRNHLTIVPHERPDLDAISGAWFAMRHARKQAMEAKHKAWAAYVCRVDAGHTTITPEQAVTPYSIFMLRMQLLKAHSPDTNNLMLRSGFDFIEEIFKWMDAGGRLDHPSGLEHVPSFHQEVQAITEDLQRYREDLKRAQRITIQLPRKNGDGYERVKGLWIDQPASAMFKSWARGDTETACSNDGFVFLGVKINEQRIILSVNPSGNVWLKGLGEMIEQAESEQRKALGMERKGKNRPGYDSPDPWYDGRSPLHDYTIIDSPRCGTVLSLVDIMKIVESFSNLNE